MTMHLVGVTKVLSDARQLRRLAEVMLPLQDRAHRMMMRSLSAIG